MEATLARDKMSQKRDQIKFTTTTITGFGTGPVYQVAIIVPCCFHPPLDPNSMPQLAIRPVVSAPLGEALSSCFAFFACCRRGLD